MEMEKGLWEDYFPLYKQGTVVSTSMLLSRGVTPAFLTI